jgi:DNA-binding transcriptional LysR family regulator
MEKLIPEIRNLVYGFYSLRNSIKLSSATRSVTFAAQHALGSGVFPALFSMIEKRVSPVTVRLRTANFPECISFLERGEVSFALCYESPFQPFEPVQTFERLRIGHEKLVPVTAADHDGNKLHDPELQNTIKLLNYTEGTFLRDVVNHGQMPRILQEYNVEIICVSALAIALKHLVLAGMGLAWLPLTLIEDDLRNGRLVSLEESLGIIDLPITLLKNPVHANKLATSVWNMIAESGTDLFGQSK